MVTINKTILYKNLSRKAKGETMAKIPREKVVALINAKRARGETDEQIFNGLIRRKDGLGENMNALVGRYAATTSDPKAMAAEYFGLDIGGKPVSKSKAKPKGLIGRSADKIGAAAKQIGKNQVSNGGIANAAGLADTALSVGGGLVDLSLDGMAQLGGGFGSLARGGGFLTGANKGSVNYNSSPVSKAVKSVAAPRTKTGERMLDVLGIADDAIMSAGDGVYEATGSPLLGTATVTGLNALGFFVGGKGAKSPAPRPAPPARPPAPRPRLTPEQVRARVTEVKAARKQSNVPPLIDTPPALNAPPISTSTNAFGRTTGSLDAAAARLNNMSGRTEIPQIDTTIPQVPPAAPIKSAPIEKLLNLNESKPRVGGAPIEVQGTRAEVLRELGIPDESVRKGSITGDITQLETEKSLSKLDTPEGLSMREKLDAEFDAMNNYANRIIEEDIGTSVGASPESRGQVIIDALEGYKEWYKTKVSEDYKKADEKSGGKGGIKLTDFESELSRASNWQGKASNQSLRRGITSYLNEMGLYDGKAKTVAPMTAKQAEGLRQYINSQWSPDSAGIIGRINSKIDDGVFKQLDDNAYVEARKRYKQYKDTFDNPKGIAKILDSEGINRKVSAEQMGKNIQLLAAKDGAQFNHIYKLLDEMPDALKPQGAAAKAEIRAAIAEIIIGKGGLKTVSKEYMQYRKPNAKGEYKANAIFGEDIAKKLDTYVAGRNILQHQDPNPSGTATTAKNIDAWNSPDNVAGVVTGVAGGVLSGGGALTAVVGGLTGKAIVSKVKSNMAAKQAKTDYSVAINPKRAEVYRQANEKLINDVIDSVEFQNIIDVFENPTPNETKVKVLQRKLTMSPAWKAYVKSLPAKARRSAMNSADVLIMLTQGANSQDEEFLKPSF